MIEDMININGKIIPESLKKSKDNWPVLFVGLVYSILLIFMFSLAMIFRILGGIIIALGQSAIFSNYLYLIENVVVYNRTRLNEFKYGFKAYFLKVYGVVFLFWFVGYTIDLFFSPLLRIGMGGLSLKLILDLIILILLNPLPEVIYQKQYDILGSIQYSFDFIRENALEWFVPNIILGILLYLAMGKFLSINSLLSGGIYMKAGNIVGYILGQVVLFFTMIYRGLLFKLLSNSSRKKRKFMRNMY
ncbi:MAG: hypothetical protein N4A57_07415 [Anaeromicrobium sp.]|jgi:hypothetical protein|uniref:hypothetical protein n=1 Tax=Anaeromicrobium sp. TaxID=1929132 RepID=UPI0025F9D2E5|nr:hypothetical protein [Anaeromicrobium sp.]MCT4594078.1 hypothetical protein [Anaeromicrobium sp.]